MKFEYPSLCHFPHPIELTEDVEGDAQIGFLDPTSGISIHAVDESTCGRFAGTPEMYQLNIEQFVEFQSLRGHVDLAVDAGVRALSRQVQTSLGIASGDLASAHFYESEPERLMRVIVVQYMVAELNSARGRG